MAPLSKTDVDEPITEASVQEKAKLKKSFRRLDLVFFIICTIVGLDALGAVADNGAQAFTWLAFLAVFFFIPYALLTAELGSAFPGEGGPYLWTRMAFGRLVGAINAVLYWLSNPIWLGGSLAITAVATFGEFFTPLGGVGKYLFSLAFIWFAVGAAVLSFSVGKWIPTVGAWIRVVLLGAFSITVILYALTHGVHGVTVGQFKPSWTVFIAAVPVLIFEYVGFELPNAAGDEMLNPRRDVPFAVLRSAVATLALYGIPILAILIVLPASQITSLGGFIDAMKTVFTVYGGHVKTEHGAVSVTLTGFGKVLGDAAAVGFIGALLSSGTTWIMGADRAQAVAGFDGAAPRFLGHFSRRWGTPVAVNLLSGVVSTVVMLLAFALTGNANKYFGAGLALAISTTTIAYLFIFPALVRLRYKHPSAERPYAIPGGNVGAWVCSGLCTLWSALAVAALLYPGFGTSDPDASLPSGWAHQRAGYELTQLVPLAALIALGVLFYILGAPTRRREVAPTPSAAALAET